MAKKQKRNLQKLINKKQRLQTIAQIADEAAPNLNELAVPTSRSTETPKVPSKTALVTGKVGSSTDINALSLGTGSELRKTVLSIIVIALLLTAAVVFDKKTPYLSRFGDWLYQTLHLQA